MTPTRAIIAAAALVALAWPAMAAENEDSPRCKALIAALASAVSGTPGQSLPGWRNGVVFFHTAMLDGLRLVCTDPLSVSFAWTGDGKPTHAWFLAGGEAGAVVTRAPQPALRQAMRRCIEQASRGDNDTQDASIDIEGARVECSTSDNGSDILMDIGPPY